MQTAQKQIDTILDIFGGADGGIAFANFKFRYEDIEKQALAGDESAIKIMQQVQGVVNLMVHLGQ